MANTYYDSQLTAAEIETVLEAVDGLIVPANNGKVIAVENGTLVAKSVTEYTDGPVLEALSVTENGDYTPGSGVDGFDEVHVAVPNSYAAADEGKVVSNGSLVAQTARSSQITQNGTYDTTLNNSVEVNVAGGGGSTLITKNITQNGTYNASDDSADGYSQVVVAVPASATIIENWDLKSSRTGSLRSFSFSTYSSASQTSSGMTFPNENSYIVENHTNLDSNLIIEADITSMNLASGINHRLIGFSTNLQGLIYNLSGKWAFSNGSTTVESSITDPEYFKNSTLKIYIDANGYWHIYKNNVLVWEPGLVYKYTSSLYFGKGSGNGIMGTTITDIRIYAL